jgi:hypothetical protein
MTAATSPWGPRLGAIGPAEDPDGVLGMGTEVPSSREVPSERTGTSSLSQIEGLNKSYANIPGGVDS